MNNFLKKSESRTDRLEEFSFSFDKFGTKIHFSIVAGDNLEEKVRRSFLKARGIYEEYDLIFNRFEDGSEISRLNSGPGIFQEASSGILEVVRKSLSYNKETEGYFDPRVADFLEKVGYSEDFQKVPRIQENEEGGPWVIGRSLEEDLKTEKKKVFFGRKMDFSGIVKGLVNDKVAEFFSKEGLDDFVVDSGGDMFFSGKNSQGKKWTVDVEGISHEKLLLEISGEGIATSGISRRKWEKGGQRRHHLINPKNPEDFKFDLRTVTVVDSSTERADVWAKTLFLMGREKGIEFSREKKIKSIFLDYSGRAWISPEISRYRV